MAVDAHSVTGSISNANGVLEPGETVEVAPTWLNTLVVPISFEGLASDLAGPAGPTYTINDDVAFYGSVAGGASANCHSASGNCFLMSVSGSRPATHWDATFTETLGPPAVADSPVLPVKTWTLHVGNSFTDVDTSRQDYPYVENLFHNGITGGCTPSPTPDDPVTRRDGRLLDEVSSGRRRRRRRPPAWFSATYRRVTSSRHGSSSSQGSRSRAVAAGASTARMMP
jgi:hypothetical protein